MKNTRFLSLLLLLFLAACQTTKPPAVNTIFVPPSYHSIGSYEGGELLPVGSYRVEAALKTKQGASRWITLYIKKEADRVDILGVDPFLKSLFRIEERLEKDKLSIINANFQITEPSLRVSRQMIQDFYFSLRPFLYAADNPKQKNPGVIDRQEDGRPKTIFLSGKGLKRAKLIIDGYLEAGIPENLHVLHPAWSADMVLYKNQ